MALCPTCHNDIGTGDLDSASRVKGSQGVDASGNPVPFWTDDPLLTKGGLNGTDFVGISKSRNLHIREIQELRNQEEEALGLALTEFSDASEDKKITRRHIVELRESVERLLAASQGTLEEYFKLDINEDEQTQNPRLTIVGEGSAPEPQIEWIDVERGAPYIDKDGNEKTEFEISSGTFEDSPTLPSRLRIRAVHIEDLRHPVAAGVKAILVATDTLGFSFTLYEGQKTGDATFKNVEKCETDA